MVAAMQRKPDPFAAAAWAARIESWIAAGITTKRQLCHVAGVSEQAIGRILRGETLKMDTRWLLAWRDCPAIHETIHEVCKEALAEPVRDAEPPATDLDGDGDTDRDDLALADHQVHQLACKGTALTLSLPHRSPDDAAAESERWSFELTRAARTKSAICAVLSHGPTFSTNGRGGTHAASSVFSRGGGR